MASVNVDLLRSLYARLLARSAGAQLELAKLATGERRPSERIVLAAREQTPGDDCELARDGDDRVAGFTFGVLERAFSPSAIRAAKPLIARRGFEPLFPP